MHMSLVQFDANDGYDQHKALWTLFSNTPGRKRDHLYRVEQDDGAKKIAIMQSASQPKSSAAVTVLETKHFAPSLTQGQYYKFKLVANPTKCIKETKRVIDLRDEAEQIQWLQRKLTGANVTVTSMDSKVILHRKCFRSRFATFEGILQINNVDQIYSSLVMGVGRKKHAGAGLLSLAQMN